MNSLGSQPTGGLFVSDIKTPMAVERCLVVIEIYKDEQMLLKVGRAEKYLDASDLQPGTIRDAYLTPLVSTVQ